jgi:ATP-dependent DNA helicase DinG
VRLATVLGKKGPLARTLPHFTHRPQQIALAEAIEDALRTGRPALAEAGTGVGKTLAYLVPLVRWLARTNRRAVISTHTLALQGQLIERDIPALLAALPDADGLRAAVLKGRQNFLCLHELEVARTELWSAGDPVFQTMERWAAETDSGDIAELDIAFPAWSELTASADSCRGRECRHFDRCFYYKARRTADDCQLLVVNHALFFADLRLRRQSPGGPTLLPSYDAVIFDEAHHVEDTATRALGMEWGSRRIPQLIARARRLPTVDPMALSALDALATRLLEPLTNHPRPEAFLHEALPTAADRAAFTAHQEAVGIATDAVVRELAAAAETATVDVDRDRAAGLARMASRIASELRAFTPDALAGTDPDAFSWVHTRRLRGGLPLTTLVRTPFTIAPLLQQALYHRTRRVGFVSATLSSLDGFVGLRARLGLDAPDDAEPPVETIQGSPFDYANRCLLYIPRHLGPPDASAESVDALLDEVERLIHAARGRTFVLFTSHRMLSLARERFDGNLPFPLFAQGTQPPPRLVDAFAAAGNGVLLGTSSFWEGVDVPGPALSCVIMDKLPFATPDAPPQRAREARIKEDGGDAFTALSLPQAALRLKQGFGRLLRTDQDRGVVAILDTRLWTRLYGAKLLGALPACPRTEQFEEVAAFLAAP